MRPGGSAPRRPRVGRAVGGAEASRCGLHPRPRRRQRTGSERLETVTKARAEAGSTGASRLPDPPSAWLCSPVQPAGQPILCAREELRDKGCAVLAHLAVPAEPASPPGLSQPQSRGRREGGEGTVPGVARAFRVWNRRAQWTRRVPGNPGSACAASDGRPAQWGCQRADLLICRRFLCVV